MQKKRFKAKKQKVGKDIIKRLILPSTIEAVIGQREGKVENRGIIRREDIKKVDLKSACSKNPPSKKPYAEKVLPTRERCGGGAQQNTP